MTKWHRRFGHHLETRSEVAVCLAQASCLKCTALITRWAPSGRCQAVALRRDDQRRAAGSPDVDRLGDYWLLPWDVARATGNTDELDRELPEAALAWAART